MELKQVMKGNVVSIAELENGKAEIIEIVGGEGGLAAGRMLNDAGFPEGAVIGAFLKGSEVIIPTGSYVLKDREHAIVFLLPEVLEDVEKFFAGQ